MSLLTEQIITESVLSTSKKIKKIKKEVSNVSVKKEESEDDSNQNSKKYKTFKTSTKKTILFDLKRGVLQQLYRFPYDDKDDKELDSESLLQMINMAELSAYNKLLAEVLKKHVSTFDSSQKSLTQWRKKIKGWLYTSEKPEYRGSPVVSSEKLPAFREEVIKILNEIPFRCFSDLRQRIIDVLLKFHKANPVTRDQSFNPNVCSKHWWFNFMQRNTDIKEMWEKIPLKRETSKHSDRQACQAASTETTSQEIEEEKAPNLAMADPIFSSGAGFVQKFGNFQREFIKNMLLKGDMKAIQHLWNLYMLSKMHIPPFQAQPGTERTMVKTESKVELKDEAKTELNNTKKEENEKIEPNNAKKEENEKIETKVKMEEESGKMALTSSGL